MMKGITWMLSRSGGVIAPVHVEELCEGDVLVVVLIVRHEFVHLAPNIQWDTRAETDYLATWRFPFSAIVETRNE